MTQLGGAAAVAAWFGASMLVLSEGRRAMAAGIALFGAGLAVTLAPDQPQVAGVLAAGALAAAGLRLRGGRPGWRILPAGSTPRLILCLVTGVVGGFAATTLLPGPGAAPARAAVVLGVIMAAARLLSTAHRDAALAAAAAMCLALGGVEGLIGADTAVAVATAAALSAVLLGLLPIPAAEVNA